MVIKMTQNDNYNEYYENSELWGNRELTLVQSQVLNILDSLCQTLPEGSRVADLGCGDGILLNKLISKYPLLECYGVDMSQESLIYVNPPIQKCHSNLEYLPFKDGFFDLCFSIDVLEHILPQKLTSVIEEIHRVCRGAILLVSPFLESDAIRTICPHCGCVFSPYYHLNRFNLKLWQSLLSKYLKDREMQFLSLGDYKPYIPMGVGNLMVASGACVSHQHQTICPQCKTSFSRPQPTSIPNLSLLLSPYAAQKRNLFGLIPEEIGVLTLPSSNTEQTKGSEISDGIWIFTKEDYNLTPEEFGTLKVQSIYEIDCGDTNIVRSGADLFRKEAYFIDNGELTSSESVLIWNAPKFDKESQNVAKTLRLVFPPEPEKKVVNLELFLASQTEGILKAVLYGIPPHNSKQIGHTNIRSDQIERAMAITLYPDDQFITSFGMLVDLLWIPKITEYGRNGNYELRFHKVIDSNFSAQIFSIKNKAANVLPCNNKTVTKKYQLKFSSQTFKKLNKLWYVEKGKIFDLLSLSWNSKEDALIANLPLIENIYDEEIIDSNVKVESDLNLFGYGYSSGMPIYEAISEQLSKIDN
jgi:SAM-dependent methyltransferase